jgi:hypothetical protein
MLSRLFALALAILAASPFTAPFATCDLAALLPVARHEAIHHRASPTRDVSAVDVQSMHVLPLKRLTGPVISSSVQTSTPVVVTPRFVARVVLIDTLTVSFHAPLRI